MSNLSDEIANDPLNRYAGLSPAEIAASLNAKDRDLNRDIMTGDEIFAATDATEFASLPDAKKSQWLAFCAKSVDPFGTANVAFVQYIFGAQSDTVTKLQAARKITNGQSRAEELGLDQITIGDLEVEGLVQGVNWQYQVTEIKEQLENANIEVEVKITDGAYSKTARTWAFDLDDAAIKAFARKFIRVAATRRANIGNISQAPSTP